MIYRSNGRRRRYYRMRCLWGGNGFRALAVLPVLLVSLPVDYAETGKTVYETFNLKSNVANIGEVPHSKSNGPGHAVRSRATRNLGLIYTVLPGASIQLGLTLAARAGGGTIVVQKDNKTITAPLIMGSNTSLRCERGTTITATSIGWTAPDFPAHIHNLNYGDQDTGLNEPITDHDLEITGCNFAAAGSFIASGTFHSIQFRKAAGIRIRHNDFHGGGNATAILASVNYVVEYNNMGLVTRGETHGNTILDNLTNTDRVVIGDTVGGPGIRPGTTVASINSATSVTLSRAAAGTSAATTLPGHSHKSTTIDNLPSTTGLSVGEYVSGSGVQPETVIVAIPNSTSVRLSKATTSSVTAGSFIFSGVPIAFGGAVNAAWDQWEGSRDGRILYNAAATRGYCILVTGADTHPSAPLMTENIVVAENRCAMQGPHTQAAIWVNGLYPGAGASDVIVRANQVSGDGTSDFVCWKITGAGKRIDVKDNSCRLSGTNSGGAVASGSGDLGGTPSAVRFSKNSYDNIQVQSSNVAVVGLGGDAQADREVITGGQYPSAVWLAGVGNIVSNVTWEPGIRRKYDFSGGIAGTVCVGSTCKRRD